MCLARKDGVAGIVRKRPTVDECRYRDVVFVSESLSSGGRIVQPGRVPSTHVDTFARDSLPARELGPEMDYSVLPQLAAYSKGRELAPRR